MELTYRDLFEKKVQRHVNRVFKQFNTGGNRMPRWAQLKKAMKGELVKVLDKVRQDAFRLMIQAYGIKKGVEDKLPDDIDTRSPVSDERIDQMIDDLIRVSRKRWHEMGRKKDPKAIKAWWHKNFGRERAKAIAITEVTFGHQDGEDTALKYLRAAGAKIKGIWRALPTACKFCKKMDGKPERYWRRFYPAGPPSPHPACNCWIDHS